LTTTHGRGAAAQTENASRVYDSPVQPAVAATTLELVGAMQLLDQVQASVIVTDVDGVVIGWNRFAEELFGWTRDDAVGRNIAELTVMPRDETTALEIMQRLGRGESWQGEFEGQRKDGMPVPLYVTDSPLRDAGGRLIGVLGVAIDMTNRARIDSERQHLLARERAARAESELLNGIAAATAGEDDLNLILALTLERLAGQVRFTGGSISLVEGDELVVRAAVGPFAESALASRLSRGRGRTWRVVETLEPYLSHDLAADGARVVSTASSNGVIRSYLAVPLVWRERAIGILEVDSTEPAAFDESDQRLVERVAIALSGPVELARRHNAEAAARRAAESSAQRTARLQATTAALAQALTVQQVATAIVEQALLDALGATAGSVALLDPTGETLEILRSIGYPGELVDRFRTLRVADETPLSRAVRTREPVFVGSLEELAEMFPALAAAGLATTNHALVAYPLLSGDDVIGAIGLSYVTEQDFPEDDRSYLLALAQQCSQAMERARLYEAEREARNSAEAAFAEATEAQRAAEESRRRLAFLVEASARLAGSVEYEVTLKSLADLAVPELADWCVLDLLEPDGTLNPVAIAHADPDELEIAHRYREDHPPDPEAPTGALAVAMSGRSEFYPEITDEMLDAATGSPERSAILRRLGLHSVIIVPLTVHDRTIGALSLVGSRARTPFGQADLELAEELGRRAAVAVDTARVYRELSRFKTTLDTTLDSVLMFDPFTLRLFYANQGAVDSLGYSREELMSMTPLQIKLEFDEPRFRALLEPLIAGLEPSVTISTIDWRKDGTSFPVEVFMQYVAPEGEPARIVAIARDVTDRVEARARLQRLAQSERALSAELKAIIRAMAEAVLVFEPAGRLMFSNPAAEALFPGKAVATYADVAGNMADPDRLPALGVGFGQGPIELRTTDDEERWLEISAYPVVASVEALGDVAGSESGQETILFMRDVTAARQARQARDAFIGVLSHELRTPVTTIYGNSKLLGRTERSRSEEVRREVFADIETEAERLYRLVEDLLVLARFGEEADSGLGNEPLLLQRIVPAVVRSEQGRWPLTKIEQRLESGLPAAKGEQTYVEQVVRNLVNNAAKYSGPGAGVEVSVKAFDGEIHVVVLDQGPGFPAEESNRLFELFYRSPHTATRASGAGIGLFVCKRLIQAMGGRVWARPRPEGGSEFGFALKVFNEEEL
jgi:PAS domain S-box-containing protein